ncbi:MAG: glycosyltransferase [Verrucomicrobiota bacterium]
MLRPPADNTLLDTYRENLLSGKTDFPLQTTPSPKQGLLKDLPSPPEGRTGWPWTQETPPPQNLENPIKISVIVISYQHGRYLEETLRSVLLQNYPNLEIIVIDGGSTDETSTILEKYRPWLSFVRSAPDRGQSHALNLGFSLASGTARGWINSDDYYLPKALLRVNRIFQDDTIEFSYGDGLNYFEETNKYQYCESFLALDRYLQFGGLVMSHTVFWRDRVQETIWEEMQCNVDGELWFRLLKGTKRYHLPLPLAVCRCQPQAKTVNPKWDQAWRDDEHKIWPVHGYAPAPRHPIRYEFRYLQRYYQKWLARKWREKRTQFLADYYPEITVP